MREFNNHVISGKAHLKALYEDNPDAIILHVA